jgi:hypothetical protein
MLPMRWISSALPFFSQRLHNRCSVVAGFRVDLYLDQFVILKAQIKLFYEIVAESLVAKDENGFQVVTNTA